MTTPQDVTVCSHWQFFRTLRIPLDDFCANVPLDLDGITRLSLTFGFGAGSQSGAVMLDGIEFTRSPFDEPAALCL